MPPPEGPSDATVAEHYRRVKSLDSSAVLERFLEQSPEIGLEQLIEVLLVDQALEWQDAPGPYVEQYLQRFPVVAGRQEGVLELEYGEIRAVRALGLPVDVDSFASRFPDLAEPLRRQFEVWEWMKDEG